MIEISCDQCGKTFETHEAWTKRGQEHFFCSRKCSHQFQKNRIRSVCLNCGERFEHSPVKDRKFCCRACYLAYHQVTKICPECGRTYTIPKAVDDRYNFCSLDCKKSASTTKTDHICERCGKPFRGHPDRHYCSEECRRPPVINTCQQCGKEFRIVPSMSYQKFCSPTCYRRFTGETEPETNMRLCLTELGEQFVQEAPLDRYPVDFYLPRLNTALEVDGVYWHSQRPNADIRKNKRLTKKGYKVIRVPASPFYGDATDDMVALVDALIRASKDDIPSLTERCRNPVVVALPPH